MPRRKSDLSRHSRKTKNKRRRRERLRLLNEIEGQLRDCVKNSQLLQNRQKNAKKTSKICTNIKDIESFEEPDKSAEYKDVEVTNEYKLEKLKQLKIENKGNRKTNEHRLKMEKLITNKNVVDAETNENKIKKIQLKKKNASDCPNMDNLVTDNENVSESYPKKIMVFLIDYAQSNNSSNQKDALQDPFLKTYSRDPLA